ncbi:DUF3280 domain-containing protein [Skermanella pratensis]|uniref:DUF3280 domain-containing protein n=1 Tax=Skermanella pratensis TaxID=2233999 RepID=UPI0013018713|nr:DUF3280 domain-containing protein [Skermanella pratensis]
MPRLIPLLIALLTAAFPAVAAPLPAAVFEIELIDTSGEGRSPAQEQRIRATTEALRRELAETGLYAPLDLAPAADRIDDHLSCERCLLDIARDMGGRVAVMGKVNKISTLILSMDIVVRDLADGKVVARGTADIRGDNDRAWLRGMEWLVEHRIAPQGAAPREERAPR